MSDAKPDIPAAIAEVRELDAKLPRSAVLPETVGHFNGLHALRTLAPQLADECERLRAVLQEIADQLLPMSGAAAMQAFSDVRDDARAALKGGEL